MRVLMMTNEYPPNIYGGAGVHVEYLSRELAGLADVEVRSFHDQQQADGRLSVRGKKVDAGRFDGCPPEFVSPLKALDTCLVFNGWGIDADIVHCHTWYAQFGGLLAQRLYDVPFVLTVHSLEPLRPWKREQLGRGYDLSTWIEKTAIESADAVIAVSRSTRDDVLNFFSVDPERVPIIPNGIDPDEYRPVERPSVVAGLGIDPARPYVLFVGRMTRQKGVVHLINAIEYIDPSIQIVLCAGDADTPEMQAELEAEVRRRQAQRPGIVWLPGMQSRETTIALYSHALVFCCPSVYEPFGIINLEAMACGTAVVASAVGGIVDVVVEGETGFKVPLPLAASPPHDPLDAPAFSRGLAAAINRLADDPELAARMGEAGRQRVLETYSWRSVAAQTMDLYRRLHDGRQ